MNSVTLGDYERPLQISHFVKDIHAGFQLLNLKNDGLRRRSDSIKYSVGIWLMQARECSSFANVIDTGEKGRRRGLRSITAQPSTSRGDIMRWVITGHMQDLDGCNYFG